MIFILKSPRGIGTIINADYKTKCIKIENKTDRILDRAFGINENPTWKQFEAFLESRCFPRTRDKMKLILKDIGVPSYNPLTLIQKTGGYMAEDDLWVEIINEEKEYENDNFER